MWRKKEEEEEEMECPGVMLETETAGSNGGCWGKGGGGTAVGIPVAEQGQCLVVGLVKGNYCLGRRQE